MTSNWTHIIICSIWSKHSNLRSERRWTLFVMSTNIWYTDGSVTIAKVVKHASGIKKEVPLWFNSKGGMALYKINELWSYFQNSDYYSILGIPAHEDIYIVYKIGATLMAKCLNIMYIACIVTMDPFAVSLTSFTVFVLTLCQVILSPSTCHYTN